MRFTKPSTQAIKFKQFDIIDRGDVVKLNEFLATNPDIIERKELYVPPIPPARAGMEVIEGVPEKQYYQFFYREK